MTEPSETGTKGTGAAGGRLSAVLLGIFLIALVWSAIVLIHPMDRVRILGLGISARQPSRPLSVAVLSIIVLAIIEVRMLHAWLAGIVTFVARYSLVFALGLAAAVVTFGFVYGAFVAGGADSYGYLSEARLWLTGTLHIPQPVMAMAPWHDAQWSFTPLGYRPAPDGTGIVPVHAPGLPLLMAAAQWLAGPRAPFCLVPLSGGLFVLATYLIGRRLGRPLVGLVAAVLVAISPTVLYMLVNPMSDLPASAAWTLAASCLVGVRRRDAAAAGVVSAVAIATRPNLVLLAGVFTALTLWRDWHESRPFSRRVTPWYLMTASIGVLAVAAINRQLYGSPFVSGYGILDYAWGHVIPNVRDYATWIGTIESPALVVGLICLLVPWMSWRWMWTTPREREAGWFFAGTIVLVSGPFLFYEVHDAWWYLRYILPIWPVALLATSAMIAALYRTRAMVAQLMAVGLVGLLCWHGVTVADKQGVFVAALNEQRYIDAARLVSRLTPPDAVILTLQHSGSLRYYAGRMTVRWDMIDPASMDEAILWINAHGHHPYLLLENWELKLMRQGYAGAGEIAKLDWTPVAALDGNEPIRLFDAVDRSRGGTTLVVPRSQPVSGFTQFVLPVDLPALVWR